MTTWPGLAMAWAAKQLGASLRLFVPRSTPGEQVWILQGLFLFLVVPRSTPDGVVFFIYFYSFSLFPNPPLIRKFGSCEFCFFLLFFFFFVPRLVLRKKVRPFKIQISPAWALAENITTFLIRGMEQRKREREKITFKIQISPTWASSDLFGESSCWPNLDLERSDFFRSEFMVERLRDLGAAVDQVGPLHLPRVIVQRVGKPN